MAPQNADQCNERCRRDLAEAVGKPPLFTEQQIAADDETRRRCRQRRAYRAAEDERKTGCAAHPGEELGLALGEGDAPGLGQAVFSLVQCDAPGCYLAGKGVHRGHPAQVSRPHRDVPYFGDLCRAGAGEDAVGQHVDVELPQMEAAGHDLHRLLHPEDLCSVFQQRLARRHDKVHDAAPLLVAGI